uniref:Dihydrolipoyllysine-residue acetyltransferase component 3 of pyruvate dehydrogenase complex n=1 Tax=Schistocephalus solidus TaxID=70667 RepID=A0A0X3P4X8_SCHSO
METEEEGVMAKIIKEVGTTNIVQETIAIIATADEDWKEVAANADAFLASLGGAASPTAAAPPTVSAPPTAAAPSEPPPVKPSEGKQLPLGPAVRLLLSSFGLTADQIPGTGPHGGQVLKGDVLNYVASKGLQKLPPSQPAAAPVASQPSPAVQAGAGFVDVPVSSMRATIAKRLSESKATIPHTYTRTKVRVDRLFALQEAINKVAAPNKISVNDLIVKACAFGLRLVPDMNGISNPSGDSLQRLVNVDICVAVSTPSGLITPIVPSADTRPISGISTLVKELAAKARDNKLQPHEFTGGSFTISNLGMFGIRDFTAIINPPQVAILAVGGGMKSMTASKVPDQGLESLTELTLTLSTDARFVDEAMAAQFLRHVKRYLEVDPEALFADDPDLTTATDSSAEELAMMAL